MYCTRCGGLVVEDRFRDWTARWHCLKCGHVADSVNEQSLLAHQEQERCLFLTNAEPEYWDEEESILVQLTRSQALAEEH